MRDKQCRTYALNSFVVATDKSWHGWGEDVPDQHHTSDVAKWMQGATTTVTVISYCDKERHATIFAGSLSHILL